MAKRPWLKKLLWIGGGGFGLLLLAALILPFVINVDSYRPQIVEAAGAHLNGKLEMGKLTLSLWGQIKVQVDGFTVSDAQGRKVVAAKDVYFHVPFLSVFTGSPVLTFKMEKPEIAVIKDASGKMNVMTLVKTSSAAPSADGAPAAAPAAPMKVPGIVAAARLGVGMYHASLVYSDKTTGLESRTEDLNLEIRDLSLTRTMKGALWATLDTSMGAVFAVKGPFRLNLEAVPELKEGAFSKATVTAVADASTLDIAAGGAFHKKPGVVAQMDLTLSASPTSATIESLVAKFHNAEVKASGTAGGWADPGGEPNFALEFASNEIALAPWTELIPMLSTYQLEGNAFMKGKASGTASKPEYALEMGLKGGKAAAPNLKAKPEFQALIQIVTDQVKQMSASVKGPGTQINVSGSVVSFTKPRFQLALTSPGIDLDQLVEFPPPAAKGAAAPAASGGTSGGAAAPAADFDAMLDPLRKNPMAVATSGTATLDIAKLKAYGVVITGMKGAFSMADLAMKVDRFAMNVFDGSIGATFAADLKPKAPSYRFSSTVAGLSLQKAVESQFALFKNTLLGNASFKMEGTGASFNPEPAKKNLNAKGNLSVAEGSFATIDVARIATEAVNRGIQKASEKVPSLKGKTLGAPGNTEAAYQTIGSDFTISGGTFSAPNFQAVSKPGKGVDLRGATTLGLIDYALNANWEIVDTHNLTKARDISVTEQGVTVNQLFAENGVVKFPIKVTGTAFAPNVNYGAVPESLAKVALNNIARAAGDKVKAEAQKKVEEQVQKAAGQAAPQIQQAVKGLGKKLFGK